MEFLAVVFGFVVGAIVGMTGVGGGSLMTPLLIGAFQLPSAVAIGTDLWFASLTKGGGAVAHARLGHVRWDIAGKLLAGSLPAALATLLWLAQADVARAGSSALTTALGVALLLTALTVAHRRGWQALARRLEPHLTARRSTALTVLAGVALGVLVTLSSIGAGAIGATLIVLLQPRLAARDIVGTDIAHAVVLTLVAAVGHAWLGHVRWGLLGALLVGSLPGIWLGARLTRRIPERALRSLLCVSLVGAGLKVLV